MPLEERIKRGLGLRGKKDTQIRERYYKGGKLDIVGKKGDGPLPGGHGGERKRYKERLEKREKNRISSTERNVLVSGPVKETRNSREKPEEKTTTAEQKKGRPYRRRGKWEIHPQEKLYGKEI